MFKQDIINFGTRTEIAEHESGTDKGEEIGLILSKVEKQLRRSGDSPLKGPYESQQVPAEDSRQKTFTGHLNIYYDERNIFRKRLADPRGE
jgi:hypothetical protein